MCCSDKLLFPAFTRVFVSLSPLALKAIMVGYASPNELIMARHKPPSGPTFTNMV